MRVIKPPRKRFFPFLAKAFPLQLNLTVRSFLSFLYTALGLSPWRVGCVFPCMALLSFMAVFSTLWCYCCFCCSASSFFLLQGHSALCWRRQGRIMGTKVPANLCLTSGSFCFLRGFLLKLVPWLRPFKELLVSHVNALVANHISLMRVGFKFRQTIPNVGV